MSEELPPQKLDAPRQSNLLRGFILACFVGLFVTLNFFPGGSNVTYDGETSLYKMNSAWMLAVTWILFSVLTAIIGRLMWRTGGLFRLAAVFMGLMSTFCLVTSPTGLNHDLRVTPKEFTVQIGSWWAPEATTVRFADFSAVTHTKPSNRRGDRGILLWMSNDSSQTVRINDLVEDAMPEILERASNAGVAIGEQLQNYEPR